MKELQEIAKKLFDVYPWITKERFCRVCAETNEINWKELWDYFNKSMLYFISIASNELLQGLIELYDKKESGILFATISEKDDFRKVVLEDNSTVEVNLKTLEGLEELVSIYKTKKVRHILNLCDSVYCDKSTTNVYEGDIIKANDHGKERIFIACLSKEYIGGDPYYLELLYTEKYGFLNPKNQPNKDNEPVLFKESLFSAKPGRYNYHCFTIGQGWKIIGNASIDYSILKA